MSVCFEDMSSISCNTYSATPDKFSISIEDVRSCPLASVHKRLVQIVIAFDEPVAWTHEISLVGCGLKSWRLDIWSLLRQVSYR